ncbi:hypothetical protein SPFL3102_01655 [Sporomusaceae bacterium FL31]|nr:hypothetical protein SPFL3101_03289 [Sporomusaceae bacterium FL31]GCE33846.1 hypothetical protein SPFL3102_01655 [Sporomusaceae bacterium]
MGVIDQAEELEWVRRRLAALEQMEAKLKVMRRLAIYAARRAPSVEKAAKVQQWINFLREEVETIDKETQRPLSMRSAD